MTTEYFIIQGLEKETGAVLLESKFCPYNIADFTRILAGGETGNDVDLFGIHYPNLDQVKQLAATGVVDFLETFQIYRLYNLRLRGDLCYLPHGEFEQCRFVDRSKKFGYVESVTRNLNEITMLRYDKEDEIDELVVQGLIVKVVSTTLKVVGTQKFSVRTIYLSLPGEEWRIEAYQLLCLLTDKVGPSEFTERYLSALFGYETWETDCWIEYVKWNRGGFSGQPFYFCINQAQLALLALNGFRAMNLAEAGYLQLVKPLAFARPDVPKLLAEGGDKAVVVCRAMLSGKLVGILSRATHPAQMEVTSALLGEFNSCLVSPVEIVSK